MKSKNFLKKRVPVTQLAMFYKKTFHGAERITSTPATTKESKKEKNLMFNLNGKTQSGNCHKKKLATISYYSILQRPTY